MKRLVRRFAGLEGSGFHRLSVAGAACVLAVTAAAAQQPRDARSEIAATATLSGRLMTDEQTPQPVARARMELSGEGQMNQSVMTDARGGFAFRGLAAGRYMLAAEKPGFVRTAYGARRAGRPGTPITLTEGQELANVSLKMARGSVITGTIRDELGQPAQGVSVRAMQFRMLNGERTLVPVALMNGPLDQMTDDRGVYRLFGLAADEYVLVATPRPLAPGDVRQMTPAEFQAVQRLALQMSVAPSTAQTPSAMPTVAYAPVFFPGTTTAADAIPIAVGPGEERAGVDLALQLVRTARIEGVVTAPGGAVPATELVMVPNGLTMSGLPMLPFSRSRPDVDGRFSFPGVSPGKYTISARMPSGQYWASADVAVDGENVSGVSLNLQPGLTISGRIALEGAPVAAPDLASARVSLTPGGSGMMLIGVGGSSEAKVDAQGWFTLANVVPGKYRLDARLGSAWTFKSAIVNGKDALDFPFEIGPNDKIGDAVLTFTNQSQEVTGTLEDATGRPAPDFTIVVFPADRAYWGAARRIRTARPGTDGRFTIRGLPAGDYRIAALVDLAQAEANDPAVIDQLVPASIPFALRDGERKVQNIRMAGGRQ